MTARDDLLAIPDDLLRSGEVAEAAFVFMDFKDAPKRWWTGFGDIDVSGHRWQGLGDLIGISEITTSYQLSAEPVTFEIAATPELLSLALNVTSRVRDRTVIVYSTLFAMNNVVIAGYTANGGEILAGQPLVTYSMFSGTMQRMPFELNGPRQRRISLECEGLFLRRNAPPHGWWSHADQQDRYGNDLGFERLPLYANDYEVKWRG